MPTYRRPRDAQSKGPAPGAAKHGRTRAETDMAQDRGVDAETPPDLKPEDAARIVANLGLTPAERLQKLDASLRSLTGWFGILNHSRHP